MAVDAIPVTSVLVARFAVGVDGKGNPVFRTRRWSNVKPEAADQAVYDAALALAGLQVHPLNAVQRQVTSELVEA
ncbi:MAG: DUF1659 domain-containing protein [Bacillota bacterium]